MKLVDFFSSRGSFLPATKDSVSCGDGGESSTTKENETNFILKVFFCSFLSSLERNRSLGLLFFCVCVYLVMVG